MTKKEFVVEVYSADDGDILICQLPKDWLPAIPVKNELVRCKDCKYWWKDAEPYSISICNRSELCMGENDYCSLAERKEE